MPDKQHHTPTGELSYYGLSLLSYLKDSHPELIAESEFIAERADSAAQAYSEAIRSGCNHIEAEEIAREELCRGLHFSPYNTLVNILWREFEAEIPEDTARQAALRLLPLCRGVLEKYDLTDDFADKPRQSGCRLMATKVRGVKATLVLASCSGTATPVTLHHIFVQLRKMSPKERQSITLPLFHCVAAGITDRPCVKKTGRLRWRRPANFTAVCCYVRIHYLYSNGIVDDSTGTSIALVTA